MPGVVLSVGLCLSQLQCRWLAGHQGLVLGQQDIKMGMWAVSRSPERPEPWSVSAEPQCTVILTFITTSGGFQQGAEWRTGEERARGRMTHQRFPSRMWQRIQDFGVNPNLPARVAQAEQGTQSCCSCGSAHPSRALLTLCSSQTPAQALGVLPFTAAFWLHLVVQEHHLQHETPLSFLCC